MSNIGNKEILSKNLIYYMDKVGKNQKELSEIVGVSPKTLNDWVKGKKYPRIDKIETLANYFGILKSDLIEEQSEKRLQMQKKNDALAAVVLRANNDGEFLSMLEKLNKLDSAKITLVKELLDAFSTTEK